MRQVGPGSCPICGMALEPETVTLDDKPDPELVDMTRRFWIALALTLPLVVLDMGQHLSGRHWLDPQLSNLDPARARDAGRAVGGLAVLRARLAVRGLAQPQHVHADRARHRRRLGLQPRRGHWRRSCFRRPSATRTARSRSTSRRPPSSPRWCCSARCWSCARARKTSGAIKALLGLAPVDRAARRRRHGDEDVALESCARRRSAARAARREGAGRRRRHRRTSVGRRVAGHRRIDAGQKERRATR